jgi:hypothetical protein
MLRKRYTVLNVEETISQRVCFVKEKEALSDEIEELKEDLIDAKEEINRLSEDDEETEEKEAEFGALADIFTKVKLG